MIKKHIQPFKSLFRNDSIRAGHSLIIKLILMLVIMMVTSTHASAASALKLFYNNQNVTYTGQKVTYKLNASTLNSSSYPGIIIDGTSLMPGYDVFSKKSLGVTYAYDKSTGEIRLAKNGLEVKMTVGSQTAYINGVETTCSLAPMLVKYGTAKVEKLMIPARFASESLGFTYSWNSSTSTATLTTSTNTPLTLFYDNKLTIYTGTQGTASVNGKKINLSETPSIIINNTAMINAWKVFANSSIKATYKFSQSTGTLVLKKDKNEVVLTLGSKTAMVNGKAMKMSEAPRLLENKTSNKTYVIVPGQSVATYLGYSYSWNSSAKRSVITTKIVVTPPELDGDDVTPLNPEKTYISYSLMTAMESEWNVLQKSISTSLNGSGATLGSILNITQMNNASSVEDVYAITSSAPFGTVSSAISGDNTLTIQMPNIISEYKTYAMNTGMVNQVNTSYDAASNATTATVYLAAQNAKYDLTLSGDNMTLYLHVYKNMIRSVEAGYKSNYDTISVIGASGLDPVITEDATHVYLDFNNTINGVGQQSNTFSDGYCMSDMTIGNLSDTSTRITVTKTKSSDYVINKTGNQFLISFYDETITNFSLLIKLPAGIDTNAITNQDLYHSRTIKITLPGDQRQFLAENPILNTNNVITNISAELNSAGNTDILIRTSRIQGYRYSVKDGNLNVLIGKPSSIYDKIIVLDAGHGGHDPGALKGSYSEKNLNYKIIVDYAADYFNSANSDIKAYWTRSDDSFVELDDRAAFADEVGADLFVSLHMNIASSSSAKGMEVYYSSYNNTPVDSGLTSEKLAAVFASNISSELGITNRGAKNSIFVVVKKNTVPSVLIELGFLSNPTDFANITNPVFQQNAAQAIFDASNYIFKQYPTGR